MVRLSLSVVNHRPALVGFDDERLGIAVAGLGHAVHGAKVGPSCVTFPANGGRVRAKPC
jgi:hypothetical protein